MWQPRSDRQLRWKEGMEQRMRKLEEMLKLGTNQQDNSNPSFTSKPQASLSTVPDSNMEAANQESTSEQRGDTSDVALNLSCNLGSFPGSSITTLTFSGTQSHYKPDLISCGLISLEAAEEYFTVYRKSMEPCICQILPEDDCLANIRTRSSLLTAAICTVGSCTASANHKKCYEAFMNEVSRRLFSWNHNFDDVPALCMGAFWLNKVSSTLIGLGTRSLFRDATIIHEPMLSLQFECLDICEAFWLLLLVYLGIFGWAYRI
jgi:hypothetical protein